MKRFIAMILCVSICISSVPIIALAETDKVNDYGLENNPLLLSEKNNVITYEAEQYPVVDANYQLVEDADASAGFGLKLGSYIAGGAYGKKIPGDLVPYKLWIKAEETSKIKVWVRAKSTAETAIFCVSENDATTANRSLYLKNGIGNYDWVCADSFIALKDESICVNIAFRSGKTTIDKILVTTDLLYFPDGMGDVYTPIVLGQDTTDYNHLHYALPPFTPRADRPRVLTNQTKLEKVRKNLYAEENKAAYERLIKDATTEPKSLKFDDCEPYIWCNAFLWILNKDEKSGKEAVKWLFKALDNETELSARTSGGKGGYNERTFRMFFLAMIYDWCYDFLSGDQKLELIGYMLYYTTQQEYPYPAITPHGRNNGHESEGDIFMGQLSCAIAVYEDYPEMYNIVAGKIFEEQLSTRNFYYENNNHMQGAHYDASRLPYEIFLIAMLEAGVSDGLIAGEPDDMIMQYIYDIKPDNYPFRHGDTNDSGARKGFITNSGLLFYYSNYFGNPYLKDKHYKEFPKTTFSYSGYSLNPVLWLIFNDPELERKSRYELPLTKFDGFGSGLMHCRTSWEEGPGDYTNTMAVRFNLEPWYTEGHDHLDSGHFDIYYKGYLAIDSGNYGSESFVDYDGTLRTETGISTPHYQNYYKRTVAHNSMLLYDPDEVDVKRFAKAVADGGQEFKMPIQNTLEYLKEEGKTGEVVAADYGEDMHSPSFSYMKADLTEAYSEHKMEKYARSLVFLNFFDDVYPGAVLVFDKMTSKNPEFKKTWLLHTQEEPVIDQETGTTIACKSEQGDNGRIINKTLLPKKENRVLSTVGGDEKEFWVNGYNWKSVRSVQFPDNGRWRLELSPKKNAATDYFFNVIHVTENDENIPVLETEMIETETHVGAKIKDRVVFFGMGDERSNKDISFELKGDGEFEILVTDVQDGEWIVYKDGKEQKRTIATTNGGDFSFKGEAGKYTLKKNKRSLKKFTRDMNYKNYIKSVDDYYYVSMNNIYYDIKLFEQDDKIYIDAEKIAKIANAGVNFTDDFIEYIAEDKIKEVPYTSEALIKKDGIYYISLDEIKDFLYITYSKPYDYIYMLSGGFSTEEYEYLEEEGMAYVISAVADEISFNPTNPVEYTCDKKNGTSWMTDVKEAYILYEFDNEYTINSADIMWTVARGHNLKVQTSLDGTNWTTVYDAMTPVAASATEFQNIPFKTSKAKYVNIIGNGNSAGSNWFGIYEVRFPVDEIYSDDEENTDGATDETTDIENPLDDDDLDIMLN